MRLILILLMLTTTPLLAPAQAAGSYSYEPSAGELVNEAKKLIVKERYKRAIRKLRTALRDEPDNADVHNYLGFAYRKSGDTENSGTHYRKALALDPNHKSALEYQGELFLTLGRLADAEANMARLRTLCPSGCEESDDLAEAIAAHKAGR